ncbi:unnamed protein product [Dibothriocephalus latus]|uniref:FUN14 domain-containing protein 1 n=1 Tax=Dibothriocephalus latus TaxID=60516 RepID=A0A3P7QN21_DIBLA|nr:unnamed protein product [Dibothriocephalus latus]
MIGIKTDASPPDNKAVDNKLTGDILNPPAHVVLMPELSNPTEGAFGSLTNGTLSASEKRSKMPNVAFGMVCGIAAGYVCATIGRWVIFLVGVAMIGLQFFEVPKQLLINWGQFVDGAKSFLQRTTKFNQTATSLCRENQVFFGSFCGGFLIGLSFF